MKKLDLIALSMVAIALFASCNSKPKDKSAGASSETGSEIKEKVEVPKKNCVLVSHTYASFSNNKEVKTTESFKFDGKQLTEVAIQMGEDTDSKYHTKFTYDQSKKLSKVESQPYNVTTQYVYDNEGKLIAIESTNSTPSSLKFQYNDKNEIVKQIAFDKQKERSISEFVYDGTGNVTSFKVTADGKPFLSGEVKYDKNINPYSLLKGFSNKLDFYGFPLGLTKNNITEVTTTYLQDLGNYKKAGEKEVVRFSYEYNENGYPVKRSKDNKDEELLIYSCEE